MKIYLMTDLEGVACVLNLEDWCVRDGRYYEAARELLTQEVNAAVEGFFAGGADEVVVADGHGQGGINPVLLDARVELMRGWPTGWPLLLDSSYDAVAFVGQHAKAGTEYAHLPHTQSMRYLDLSVNGVSIGEFGQFAMCAAEVGVPVIFGSGDRAFCKEAEALVPGILTVEVKRGTTPGTGDELETEQYARRNISAVHLHPQKARALIREGARKAVEGFRRQGPPALVELRPPFERVARFRAYGDRPRTVSRESHPDSVIELMNAPFDPKPCG